MFRPGRQLKLELEPKPLKGKTILEWAGATHLTTILVFTDILDSTKLCAQLGDAAWVHVLIKHFNKARQLCISNQGYEIKLIGDAYMAAFKKIRDAFLFVEKLYIDTGDPRIELRAGVHVGQVRIIQDDIFGSMVNYTARVQHSWDGPVIAFSDFAKREFESEYGSKQKIVSFTRKEVDELKGFSGSHVTWAAMTTGMREAQEARLKGIQTTPSTWGKNPAQVSQKPSNKKW